jgi:hypothetical protein
MEKIHLEFAREFESEIMKIISLTEANKNATNNTSQNSTASFFTPEQTFEKFEIEENFPKDRNVTNPSVQTGRGLNFISTRSRNNAFPYSYYNSIPQHGNKVSSSRGRLPVFDFHIKKIDDSSYEKIVID